VAFIVFMIVAIGIAGLITAGLWNALMPAMLRLPPITFWQAVGLLFLSRLLFGRFGEWVPRPWKSRFVRGWKDLTPEERERFRRAMGSHCTPNFGESETGEKTS